MSEPSFLTLEEILFIHQQEIQISGGDPTIRDKEGAKLALMRQKWVLVETISMTYLEWQQAISQVFQYDIPSWMGANEQL